MLMTYKCYKFNCHTICR